MCGIIGYRTGSVIYANRGLVMGFCMILVFHTVGSGICWPIRDVWGLREVKHIFFFSLSVRVPESLASLPQIRHFPYEITGSNFGRKKTNKCFCLYYSPIPCRNIAKPSSISTIPVTPVMFQYPPRIVILPTFPHGTSETQIPSINHIITSSGSSENPLKPPPPLTYNLARSQVSPTGNLPLPQPENTKISKWRNQALKHTRTRRTLDWRLIPDELAWLFQSPQPPPSPSRSDHAGGPKPPRNA